MKRVVIITGGGSGIGRALCHNFAGKGWNVCIADISGGRAQKTSAEISQRGTGALPVSVDIRNRKQVKNMLNICLASFGHIDALINNAGVTDKKHRVIFDVPYKIWEEIIAVNVNGTFTCLKECGNIMRKQKRGNIVNITSLLGQRDFSWTGNTAYGISKAALEALTVYAADELKDYSINVNSAYPGVMVNTGFFDYLDEDERKKLAVPSILDELAYVLCCLGPAELSGKSFCAEDWKQDSEIRDLYSKYIGDVPAPSQGL
jgi:3-oxoacyl-[acyl-carrier protein] reductase